MKRAKPFDHTLMANVAFILSCTAFTHSHGNFRSKITLDIKGRACMVMKLTLLKNLVETSKAVVSVIATEIQLVSS